jgi:hypothetical protein
MFLLEKILGLAFLALIVYLVGALILFRKFGVTF